MRLYEISSSCWRAMIQYGQKSLKRYLQRVEEERKQSQEERAVKLVHSHSLSVVEIKPASQPQPEQQVQGVLRHSTHRYEIIADDIIRAM